MGEGEGERERERERREEGEKERGKERERKRERKRYYYLSNILDLNTHPHTLAVCKHMCVTKSPRNSSLFNCLPRAMQTVLTNSWKNPA